MLATEMLLEMRGDGAGESVAASHGEAIGGAKAARDLQRNPIRTESTAGGDESLVSRIVAQPQEGGELTKEETGCRWTHWETAPACG